MTKKNSEPTSASLAKLIQRDAPELYVRAVHRGRREAMYGDDRDASQDETTLALNGLSLLADEVENPPAAQNTPPAKNTAQDAETQDAG